MKLILQVAACVLLLLSFVARTSLAETVDLDPEKRWQQLNTKVETAYAKGQYQQGVVLAEQAYTYALEHFGQEHPTTLESLNNLAQLYESQGRYSEAEPLLIKCLRLRERVLGSEHPDTLVSLNNLALLHYSQGRYGEAESLYKKSLQLNEKVLGLKHPLTLNSINNLASLYSSQGRYGDAEPLLKKSLQLSEKVLGLEHPLTLYSINNLAVLYKSMGRYGDAEPLSKKSLQLRKKVLGREHPDTLVSLDNLAVLYLYQGRYDDAEPLSKKSLQLNEKVLGIEHPDTLSSINNLAEVYRFQGRYGEAEPLYKKSLQLSKKILGREHPDTLISMDNLAGLYKSQGRYSDAEPLYEKNLQLREKVLGIEHPSTLVSMNNLAMLYKSQGRYGDAESLYKKILQLSEKTLGSEHPSTLVSINNLAGLYKSQGRYGDAESLYKKCLQLSEKILGSEHPSTLVSINNLAGVYKFQGRYGDAKPLYKKCLQLSRKVLGAKHPQTLVIQANYVVLLVAMNQEKTALWQLKNQEKGLLSRSFQELYTSSTDKVRRLYLHSISTFQDIVFSLALEQVGENYQQYAANVLLRWKQIYAEESGFQHRQLHTSLNPEVKALRTRIEQTRAALGQVMGQAEVDVDVAEELREQLYQDETAIRRMARRFSSELKVAGVGMDQVLSRLESTSGLIEFRVFQPVDFKTGKRIQKHLAALLLLGNPEADEQFLFRDLGSLQPIVEHITKNDQYTSQVYDQLFGIFDEKIKGLQQLYIAPDSILNLISFAALRLPDGRFFVERQPVARVQSGRDLLKENNAAPAHGIVVMGGVDYGSGTVKKAAVRTMESGIGAYPNLRAASELEDMAYLKQSKPEAENIADIYFSNRKKGETDKPVFLTGTDANEKRLKNLQQPPRILHLSTHGFYRANKDKSEIADETPLLLSGLALAGANQGLKGGLDKDGNDGLLYSLEVLGLNLQGTELVSLSACDTGKGVVDYSEGVYGLVRAFRIAGAESVLMTLRPVGDRSAREFMETFYENWLGSSDDCSPAEALHQTRLDFIHHENAAYRDPEVWSSYVLVGK